jgi:hypothetical protein
MCVSSALAEFTGTTLYLGRQTHAEHGLIHVLGYQNTAVNLADGPNSMLLHLPAVGMTPGSLVDVGRDDNFLDRIVAGAIPVSRSLSMDWMSADDGVQVFEHDIYTMVLAPDATMLPSALHRVDPRKRPVLDPELMAFYADLYPRHAMLLCCFDNADAQRAKPLLLWYEPQEPDLLVAPALDCHTGAPPDLSADVLVDHRVVFGTDAAPPGWGRPISYSPDMRHKLRAYLPSSALGARHRGWRPNGDFAIAHDDLLAANMDAVYRLTPG